MYNLDKEMKDFDNSTPLKNALTRGEDHGERTKKVMTEYLFTKQHTHRKTTENLNLEVALAAVLDIGPITATDSWIFLLG